MEKHIYLVRHGETDSNKGSIMLGPKAMLTEEGKKQAEIVAERIKRIGVDAIISSTYPRALDTAQAIADRTNLVVEPSNLFIEWERQSSRLGKSWNDPDMKQMDDELLQAYITNDAHVHSDEETFLTLRDRGIAALKFLEEHPAENICVVSHGLFMRLLFGVALFGKSFTGAHFNRLYTLGLDNTGVTSLSFTSERGLRVHTWNDSAHLG